MQRFEKNNRFSVAIVGCVGLPARYGGFETLAENLTHHHRDHVKNVNLVVYCSALEYAQKLSVYETATLRYVPLRANGKLAMFYDIWSLIDASFRSADVILLLGHGGSFVIPLLKLVTKTRFITNIDGIEWQRQKWSSLVRWIIRKTEIYAVRHSHLVIADNEAIREYVANEYDQSCRLIPYGGDHALCAEPDLASVKNLPFNYALALCRIEPENNVAMILEAFANLQIPLVFVGDWDVSDYGRKLKARYANCANITLHDKVFEPRILRAIRDRATMYIHGHSAGGTNPSLVEMMHFSIPVIAHGCRFNRYTTEEKASYFLCADSLKNAVRAITPLTAFQIGSDMLEIAQRRYSWKQISEAYFNLFESV